MRGRLAHYQTEPRSVGTRERREEHFWFFLDKYWDEITSQHHLRMYEGAICIIGASLGDDSDVILWDIHVDNKVMHGFPVRRSDVP